MTNLNLDENTAKYQIRAYQPGMIKINDVCYTQSIIIAPNQLIPHWPPSTIHELTSLSLQPVIAMKPDVLLIGTGSTHVFIAVSIYGDCINHGIGVEIMDTSAACRTYNALTAENRNVVAALIIK